MATVAYAYNVVGILRDDKEKGTDPTESQIVRASAWKVTAGAQNQIAASVNSEFRNKFSLVFFYILLFLFI